MDKSLSQKDLAQKVNEKPSVVQDYESGKAIPSNQVLAKLERALGVKLRGKRLAIIAEIETVHHDIGSLSGLGHRY